jgi:hypothetical protein
MKLGNRWFRSCVVLMRWVELNLGEISFSLLWIAGFVMMGVTFGGWFWGFGGGAVVVGAMAAVVVQHLMLRIGLSGNDGLPSNRGKILKCVLIPDDLYDALETAALRRKLAVRQLIIEIIRDSLLLDDWLAR